MAKSKAKSKNKPVLPLLATGFDIPKNMDGLQHTYNGDFKKIRNYRKGPVVLSLANCVPPKDFKGPFLDGLYFAFIKELPRLIFGGMNLCVLFNDPVCQDVRIYPDSVIDMSSVNPKDRSEWSSSDLKIPKNKLLSSEFYLFRYFEDEFLKSSGLLKKLNDSIKQGKLGYYYQYDSGGIFFVNAMQLGFSGDGYRIAKDYTSYGKYVQVDWSKTIYNKLIKVLELSLMSCWQNTPGTHNFHKQHLPTPCDLMKTVKRFDLVVDIRQKNKVVYCKGEQMKLSPAGISVLLGILSCEKEWEFKFAVTSQNSFGYHGKEDYKIREIKKTYSGPLKKCLNKIGYDIEHFDTEDAPAYQSNEHNYEVNRKYKIVIPSKMKILILMDPDEHVLYKLDQ